MSTSKPILAAVATLCLLQGCATPPPAQAPRAMRMEPLLQVQNSGSQTAATYYQLGKFHQERGNKDAARAAYVQSIGLDRRQVEARNALAVLYSEDGKLDDAKALLTQLVQDYPRIAYLHNNLAYVHLLRGEPDAAIAPLKNALALDPGNARALNNLGLVQTALIEKRNRLTAALGIADVIVGRTAEAGPVEADRPSTASAAIPAPASRPMPAAVPPLAASPVVQEPQSPQSTMEVVQVLPNVIELRQRQAAPAVVAERRPEKVEASLRAIEARSTEPKTEPKPGEAKSLPVMPTQPRPFRFDVANGNGVPGMGVKMRNALAQRGIYALRVTNKRPFNTEITEIQYLAGFEKEARRVRSAMASRVLLTPVTSIAGQQDVRLVLGKDAAGHAALLDDAQNLAMNDRAAR